MAGGRWLGSPHVPRALTRALATAAAPLLVVVAFVVALTATGSSSADTGRWLLVVTVGLMLPGLAVTRSVRRTPAPLGDDLAWSIPVGALVGLVGWATSLVIAVPGWAWGLIVTGVVLSVPSTRRRATTRPRGRWGVPSALPICAVMVVALAWMSREYLSWTPVNPGPRGHLYYPDSVYQLSLVSEFGRTAAPQYPMVAGEPLGYHWFLYALEHQLGLGSGIDRLDLVLRLAPVSVLLGSLMMVAVVARQVAGRAIAGPIAVAMVGLVGASTATRWSATGIGFSMVHSHWWSGTPQTFGWIGGLAVVGTGLAWVRRSCSDRIAPVVLLPLLAVLTSGAKSSMLPVLAGGFGVAALVGLLQRDRLQAVRAAAVTGVILAAMALAIATIYRGQSYGLRIAPGRGLVSVAGALFPGLAHVQPKATYLLAGHLPRAATLAGTMLWLVPQLIRWLGIGWLVHHRFRDPATWVTVGCGIAGLLALVVFRHPGGSEVYFVISAFPIVVVGSAAGLATALPRGAALRGWLPGGFVAIGFGAAIATVVSLWAGSPSPLVSWQRRFGASPTAAQVSVVHQIWAWSWPLLTALVAAALLALACWIALRRRSVALLAGFGALLGVGCFATGGLVAGADPPSLPERTAAANTGGPPALTRDLVTAGRWLRGHARSSDVVAINRACVPPGIALTRLCSSQQFTVTAATGLRSDVDGWAYAARNLKAAWNSGNARYPYLPFWDQPRLDRELAAFTAPDQGRYDALYASGVRWLLADRPSAPLPTSRIDVFADRRLTLGTVTVWQLRPPGGGPS